MPVTNGIGHSLATISKQHGFEKVISQHVSACGRILKKHESWAPQTYFYIDANAGCGSNDDEACDGSPVVFLKNARRIGQQYRAWFVEIEPGNSLYLRERVARWPACEVVTGDNREHVPQIINRLPRNAYGLLYSDPNGVPNFDLLNLVSHHPNCSKLDILIRYTGSGVKRAGSIKLLDYLATINKKYWMVRDLESGDKWQWTFLLGLNWGGMSDWKSQGFHWADSEQGQDIIERLNYTNRERHELRQTALPLVL